MGPSAKVAFDADAAGPPRWPKASPGARGSRSPSSRSKPTPKGDYVFAKVFQPGKLAVDLLEEWLPQATRKLNFPKSMRWAEGGPLRFARPINWLCALYGERAPAL